MTPPFFRNRCLPGTVPAAAEPDGGTSFMVGVVDSPYLVSVLALIQIKLKRSKHEALETDTGTTHLTWNNRRNFFF